MAGKIGIVIIALLVCGLYMTLTAPLTVEAGHIAVVQSSIFGISDTVYDPSRGNWVWTRTIPGDSEVYSFPEGQFLTRHALTVILPPGKLPGMDNTNDFICALEIALSWNISRGSLVTLVQNGITNKEALAARALDRIEPLLRNALVNETERALLANRVPNLVPATTGVIEREAMPLLTEFLSSLDVELIRLNAYWLHLPDPTRYARMRAVLQEADLQLSEYIRDWRRADADLERKALDDERRRQFLHSVAKLVTEYPRLLDYLAITKLSDKIRLALLPLGGGSSDLALSGILQLVHRSLHPHLPGADSPEE